MVFIPYHIIIESHPKNLIDIRHTIDSALSQTSLSKEDCGTIILAVDEACSNIIRHSYKNDHTKTIEVHTQVSHELLSIIIIDQGIEFDINTIEKRDVSEVKPGGLGIYIIHHTMDTVEYSRSKDGFNQLKLTKKI